MANKDWHGLMKVLKVQHLRGGEVIWEAENLLNMFHLAGEQRLLQYVFAGHSIPASFYIGLDARPTLLEANVMSDLVAEPTTGGYVRQAVSSNSFTVAAVSGVYRATSPIVTFSASVSGTWGPVTNIFLADAAGTGGTLIATAPLGQSVTVANGDSVLMQFATALRDSPS